MLLKGKYNKKSLLKIPFYFFNRAFRIDSNCVEAHKYHYLYLLCKEGNYTDVSFFKSRLNLYDLYKGTTSI